MASQIPVSDWGDLPHDLLIRILDPSQPEDPFDACAAACVCRHWRHTENNRHIANVSILISVPRAWDPHSQLWWLRSHANVKSLNISATGSWHPCYSEHTFQVDKHAKFAVQLLLAVPMACEALSIGEFVAQELADDPSWLPHLPQLKTLLLHCRKDFVKRSIRMIQEQAAGLAALTELVIEITPGFGDTELNDILMPKERLGELLEAVAHLPGLRALSARTFVCSNFRGMIEAAPQLRELRLRDCLLAVSVQDIRALDALKARLEVLDLRGTTHPLDLSMASVSWLYDFSGGTNLRVLNLSSINSVRGMPSPLLLPHNLAELDLTGCCFGGRHPLALPESMRQLTLSQCHSNITSAYLQGFPLLSVAFVEVEDMPITRSELQNLAPGLTRLELLPTTTSEWGILPSFTKLRSLASGCGRGGPQLHSSLDKLTKLQLAFVGDVGSDLSYLTQLKELSLGCTRSAAFTGQLPSSLTLLTLDDALTRYQNIGDCNAEAAQAIIKAQSDMLQPLKQLRRLVWVENCLEGRITLPWPKLPVNLEELELTSGSGDNWEVLLPMHSLRRLTVRQDARGSSVLQKVLTLMPRLHTVMYHGPCIGEGIHGYWAHRGSPWLQLNTLLQSDDDDTDAEYEDEDEDEDAMDDDCEYCFEDNYGRPWED